ncbi:MAG: dCTP deaminase [Candidatus Marsarchaeota archaeon]|nr:dCTP deaminase [Candidatus Marsarchaeota archaeon]
MLAKSEILKMVEDGRLRILPFEKSQVGAGSIDLHLGNEFRVFEEQKGILDVSEELSHNTISSVMTADKKEGIIMEPGDFINGITEEVITLPQNVSGRIEGRSRFARIGLLVHVSSGFVQPGSNGKVVLEIANLSKVKLRLKPGVKICQIILEEVKGKGSYSGHYSKQEHP